MKYFVLPALVLLLFVCGCAEKKIDKENSEVVVEMPEVSVEKVYPAPSQPRKYPRSEFESPDGNKLLELGDRYLREGNHEIAKEYWELATKHEDVAGEAHLKLAELYMMQPVQNKAKASKHYKKAIDLLDNNGKKRLAAETSFKLAKMYTEVDRMRESIAILARSTKIDRYYGPPYCLLADIMDVSDKEGRDAQVDICKACVKYASKEYTKECEEIIRRFEGSE